MARNDDDLFGLQYFPLQLENKDVSRCDRTREVTRTLMGGL